MSDLSDEAAAAAAAERGDRAKVASGHRVWAFDPVAGKWVAPGDHMILFESWSPLCLGCGFEVEWAACRRRMGAWVYTVTCECGVGRLVSRFRLLVGGPERYWTSAYGRMIRWEITRRFGE